jgi:hypothetical protein
VLGPVQVAVARHHPGQVGSGEVAHEQAWHGAYSPVRSDGATRATR